MVTDLTKEHPNKTLWRFLLPMLFSVMFQQIYNIADSMIAGRFAGENALAAVGASYPITIIFMAFAVGMNLGASVVVSRLFGAEDRGGVKRAVTTAFLSSMVLGIMLTLFGYFFNHQMMRWIRTPQNIMADGVLYLKIYIFGIIFLMLYNVSTGVFTALGDSKTPLYFLLGSSAGNIILDYIFVAKFHWGVSGVAWATFIAQGVSAVLALVTLLGRLQKFAGKEKQPWFDKKLFGQIMAIAIPSILQQSVLSVGNLFVQGIVNQFGSAVVAGYSGAIKLNTFAINIFMTLGSCLSSYTAQNIGAEQKDRVREGYRAVTIMVLGFAAVICLALELSGDSLAYLFLGADGTPAAMQTAVSCMMFMGWFYCLIGFKMTADGVLRGAGDMKLFTVANLVNLGIRVLVAVTMAPRFGIFMVWAAVPVGWTANWLISYCRYRTGKWEKR